MRHYSKITFVVIILMYSIIMNGENNITPKYLLDSIPEKWSTSANIFNSDNINDAWWKSFNDTALDSLITKGVANNYNILMAQRRINIAKANVMNAKSGYYPSITLDAGWIKNRTSGDMYNQSANSSKTDYFSIGANLSWQIDLFGQITKQVQEQKANWRASKAQYDGVITALCGNIANSYINLRVTQSEFAVAMAHIKYQKTVCDLTEARFKSGLTSMLDVNQAKTVYFSTLSRLPSLQSNIETQINIIATLIGEYPDNIKDWLSKPRPIPQYNQIVSVSIPFDLLRRRPDIRQAEQEIGIYSAALGIANKEYLPVLTLNGSIGFDSHSIDKMFDNRSLNYSIAPKLSWTLFDGLSRRAGVIVAKEQMEIGIENYNFTILTAYQDVTNSMISYKYTLSSITALDAVMNEAKSTLDLSIELYKKGLSAFTNVVNAQLTYLEYNTSLVQAQGDALNSLISLYEAMGGGWETSESMNNNK